MPEEVSMRSVPRTGMSFSPRTPTRGNWTWLTSGLIAAAALTVVLVQASGGGCRAGTSESLSAAAGAAGGPGRVPASSPAGAPASSPASGTPSPAAAPGSAGTGQAVRAVALYYDPGSAVGSCTLGPFPADGLYASLPPHRYGKGTLCGSYLRVRGPHGTVRAEVVDLCPGCAADTINLSRTAFGKIVGTGSAEVTYWPEPDPALPGPVEVRVGTTDSGLTALQVVNNGNPLRSVAIEAAGGSAKPTASASPAASGGATPAPGGWQELTPNTNDFWVASGQVSTGTFTVRVTDDRGHQVLLPRVRLRPGTMIRTRTLMYHAAASPSPASTGPASTGPAQPSPAASGAGAAPVAASPTRTASPGPAC
jgi:expansin (peptidoglycan-binding protein)